MSGVKALRKIQIGREETAGTLVDATAVWRGMGTIEDQREVVFVDEDIGILGGADRVYIPSYLGAITMEETPATFEQAPHIFEAGIKASTTGVADSGGSGYIYTYTFPVSTLNAIQSYTIEGGDNQGEEEMGYCFVDSFKLSGAGGKAVMMSADWFGRQVQPGVYTTSLSVPTVEDMLFSKGSMYLDTAGGTIGTTPVSNTLLEAVLNVKTGIIPKRSADGSLDFSFLQYTPPVITFDVVFEHNATAVAEKALWVANTPRLLRWQNLGTALATAGDHTYKTLWVDLAGKWEVFNKIGEQNGNDVLAGTFRARYNSVAAKFAEILVVNELAAIP